MNKLFLAVTIALLAVALPCCGVKKEPEAAAEKIVPEGPSFPIVSAEQRQKAPEITGPALDGSSFRLSEHQGKVVLVDFWATWCGPCRRTIPHLVELQAELAGEGLEDVGVSLDRGIGVASVEPTARKLGINYPIVIDSEASFARAYGGVESIPTFFLIDREGRVASRVVGGVPKEPIENTLLKLLAEG